MQLRPLAVQSAMLGAGALEASRPGPLLVQTLTAAKGGPVH